MNYGPRYRARRSATHVLHGDLIAHRGNIKAPFSQRCVKAAQRALGYFNVILFSNWIQILYFLLSTPRFTYEVSKRPTIKT